MILAVVVTALLFDPVRKWIQDKLDQFFYRTRYDYRRTLIEFGREMSSETDLDKMLAAVVDRLARTLMVDRVAIFLANSDSSRFELAKSFGLAHIGGLDLSFLAKTRIEDAAGHIFFENTHQVPRETPAAQEAIGRLDLNYYIPCHAQQKTIAFLGLGKTMDGDFLSTSASPSKTAASTLRWSRKSLNTNASRTSTKTSSSPSTSACWLSTCKTGSSPGTRRWK